MKVCAIVGGGQIGSRHLQAMAGLPGPLKVFVVDPSAESLFRAERLFQDAAADDCDVSAEFLSRIGQLPRKIDLAIVATSAKHRLLALQQLLDQCLVVSVILEKFLFQSLDSYREAGMLLQQRRVKAWVNCPRRLWPFYQDIGNRLGGEAIRYRVTGSNWGLGCNAIHFLDHLAFLAADREYIIEEAQLAISSNSKREGFVEFTGMLRGRTSRGSEFEIVSLDCPGKPLELSIVGDQIEFKINETEQTGWLDDGRSLEGRVDMQFSIPYVSQTSRIACHDILVGAECGLVGYEESAALHQPLLRTFLEAFNARVDEATLVCPIT